MNEDGGVAEGSQESGVLSGAPGRPTPFGSARHRFHKALTVLHERNGLRSLRDLQRELRKVSPGDAYSVSAIHKILTGKQLPNEFDRARLLLRVLGATDDEVGQVYRLYIEARRQTSTDTSDAEVRVAVEAEAYPPPLDVSASVQGDVAAGVEPDWKAETLLSNAAALASDERWSAATSFLKELLNEFDRAGDYERTARATRLLVDIEIAQCHWKEAIPYLTRLIELQRHMGLLSLQEFAALWLERIWAHIVIYEYREADEQLRELLKVDSVDIPDELWRYAWELSIGLFKDAQCRLPSAVRQSGQDKQMLLETEARLVVGALNRLLPENHPGTLEWHAQLLYVLARRPVRRAETLEECQRLMDRLRRSSEESPDAFRIWRDASRFLAGIDADLAAEEMQAQLDACLRRENADADQTLEVAMEYVNLLHASGRIAHAAATLRGVLLHSRRLAGIASETARITKGRLSDLEQRCSELYPDEEFRDIS